MSSLPFSARLLDHLVLPVADLATTRARFAALGFIVAADALHPFGTENACVFLADGTYLEPLSVASREDCEVARKAGNVFVARDQAFRFRHGEGFSGLAVATSDAERDDARFRREGLSAGDMLSFERPVSLPGGGVSVAAFRLAFAADLRAPDFLLFACQRLNPLPADRSALTGHANGVTGMAAAVLTEENPTDFQYLLEQAFDTREIEAHSFGMTLASPTTRIEVLTPEGLGAHYGLEPIARERGLRGAAVVFSCLDLSVTERLLAASGVAHVNRPGRLVVPQTAGQGVAFIFEEQA